MKRIALTACVAVALLSACGGGGSGTTPATSQPLNSTVQINLGDGPADRLLAVGMTVDTLKLMGADGVSVSVLPAPRPMEMMRLMGTVSPLALASVPQGTYSAALLTVGAATVVFVDVAIGQPVQKQVPGPMTASVTFEPALVVGSTPMVVNLDMNMAASVAIDAAGNVSMMPVVSASMNPAIPGGPDPEDGGMRGVSGTVSSVAGGGFTLATMQGLTGMTLMTNAGTQFAGIDGMGMMVNSLPVSLDARLQADGRWLASRVQSQAGAGAMATGLVTSTSGNPPTQLVLVVQDGLGVGMMSSNLAATATVNIDDATQFSIDARGVDLTGLPFTPRFDRLSIVAGQRVQAFSTGQMMQGGGMGGMMGGGTVTGTSIQLGEQGLRGAVADYGSNGGQATFTLALPADSAFSRLTGAGTVTVYRQSATQMRGLPTIANGSSVQVRGLLFLDGSVFRMVAGRIVVS